MERESNKIYIYPLLAYKQKKPIRSEQIKMAHSVPQSVLSGFSFRKVQINLLIPWFLLLFGLVAPTYGRVAGKVGHSNHYYNGKY